MDRDIAIRIDALLVNAIGNIDIISDFMKKNISEEDFKKYIGHMGHCMYHLIEFSEELRSLYPDLVAPHLKRPL